MSTGAGCQFVERKPGEWYLRLQQYPYGHTEDYDEYGPYPTFDLAHDRLSDFANPGGYITYLHEDHRHDYRGPHDACAGCGGEKPTEYDCGCVNWHTTPCPETDVRVSLDLKLGRLRNIVEGRDYGAFASAAKDALRRHGIQ